MKTHFTRHAWSRILGRLSLSPSDVAQLLDRNIAVDVGVEPGSNRQHRVFFSEPDRVCFVAIQDMKNGAVVTVLPVHFHDQIAWQVSAEAQEAAQVLAFQATAAVDGRMSRLDGLQVASALRITAYHRAADGSARARGLGTWPWASGDGSFDALQRDEVFWKAIEARLVDKGVRPQEVDSVYVRLGNNGQPQRLELQRRIPNAA